MFKKSTYKISLIYTDNTETIKRGCTKPSLQGDVLHFKMGGNENFVNFDKLFAFSYVKE